MHYHTCTGPTVRSTTASKGAHNILFMDACPWIAIVDDDPSVLKALTRALRVRAFLTRTYGSAQEFLDALPGGLPDCLIVDLQMPGMTGLELLQHLTCKGIRIPTIVITAHGDIGFRERCESAGAVAFLSKPLQNAALFAAVEAAMRIPSGGLVVRPPR
jgi:FixJ family two-component response regulator